MSTLNESGRQAAPRRIVWSIAGTDSGGGAGLAADLRMADAFGVHLCPVVAAVTAQNSHSVTCVEAMPVDLVDAQLQALSDDMPPAAIKTGLLGSAAQVRCIARWVDRLRAHGPLALVVDPVLGASTGARFADADMIRAYHDELLPRATLVTPNRREALMLPDADDREHDLPAMAQALRSAGSQSVCITGGDSADFDGLVLDWISTPHAQGWLASPRIETPHTHATGCSFATAAASAFALDFVVADALVLAKMATTHALRRAYAAGAGAGPVHAGEGFAVDPDLLPLLSWGEEAFFATLPAYAGDTNSGSPKGTLGLYAIVESSERVRQALSAGIRTLQLRIKPSSQPDASWHSRLRAEVQASIGACREAGAELFINDHWQLARESGASGVHLGQEDLLALGEDGRRLLLDSGLALGISSHSLWELCRARSLSPRYIACGPVWPTLTKAMPWHPQGMDNLAWWVHMAGVPVVAIGGVLEPQQVEMASRSGADGVCVVRALGDDPQASVPALRAAWHTGRWGERLPTPSMPHPSLPASQRQ
ncbi:MAG TPA: bifunctional hydroxymethylpyrimidine kinase/phosphomethylpyrimidine kinase [Burkholderiaceae bacterium]|nr:bifunctional hydroxymethylpyrimidine kinase/phosphomethylpyrimidine kinase [Burkholderiaceae bacterium]